MESECNQRVKSSLTPPGRCNMGGSDNSRTLILWTSACGPAAISTDAPMHGDQGSICRVPKCRHIDSTDCPYYTENK